jgi:hypothetical protein
LEDLGLDGKMILKCLFKTIIGKIGLIRLMIRISVGFFEGGNEFLGSIKCEEFLD